MRCLLLFVLSVAISCKTPQGFNAFSYSSHKEVHSKNGAVVSAHPLASKVGVEVMKKGGNAFDAAIATQFALAVVYPGAGNIGGGGFMVARTQKGELLSLDYREMAPSSAHKDMYLDSLGNIIESKSLRGPSASGVPGTVAGIFETLKYAKLPIAELINPAIDFAENGFAITEGEARALNNLQDEFRKYNTALTAFQKPTQWIAGDTLIQKDLAETLKRIRDQGARGFYEGSIAELIVEEMKNNGGYINAGDLTSYKAKWRAPHSFDYKGYSVVSMGSPSSGGILLNQMLKMLEVRPVAEYGCLSTRAVQLMIEIERRAYADRSQYLGDADFINVPVTDLTNDEYLKQRMQDYRADVAGRSENVKPGRLSVESEETTHLSIVDNQGNAVAITTTLNDSYGSKTVVSGAGFLLNNEMDDFSVKPGAPNLYGAIGGEANAIAPGKRMLSSMSPTIVLKDNKPVLIAGTPGGTTIPTSLFQTIVDIIDFKLGTSDAVNYPKFHHQWLPDQVDVEKHFPDSTRLSLEKMGYKIVTRQSIGRTEVIRVLEDGTFEAVADGRGDDGAEGY